MTEQRTRRTRPRHIRFISLRLSAVGLTMCLGLTACSSDPTASTDRPDKSAPSSATPTPSSSTEAPDTAAGKQLTWFLDATRTLPIDKKTIVERFDPVTLDQAPPDVLNQAFSSLTPPGGLKMSSTESTSPAALVAIVETSQGPLKLSLSTGADGKIVGLLFSVIPEASPTSWGEIDQRLGAVAPHAAMVIAEVDAGGTCKAVHTLGADRAQPLGSMFKLYVLGAVARQVRAGKLSWDQQLTITEKNKSLPSGVLQDEPAGTKISVTDAATKMISISDNTAADLLALEVGRSAVESAQRTMGSAHASRNVPFLRTKELFVLKGADYPAYADAYLRLSPEARVTYLDTTIDEVPLSKVTPWQESRDIDSLEWFASPSDLCNAFSTLGLLAAEPALDPIETIMSTDDGGLDLDKETWPQVWFKGGSEPGVLTLGWRATTAEGRSFVSVLMTADPKTPIDENAAVRELLALAHGSFALAAD